MPEAKTSRMLTTPLSSRPSTTGRWRNPLVSITSAASPTVISEVAVLGSLVIHRETGDLVRSEPEAAARSTSRSVRMPASQEPSMTTAEPTRIFTIMLVTSATERSAEVVRTSVVMMSRSWITLALPPHRTLDLAAAANLISVEVSRRVGRIHEFLVQQPPQRPRPRADARPRPPKDLHARLVQLAVGVVGAHGIGNRLQPGDRIQEAIRDVRHWRSFHHAVSPASVEGGLPAFRRVWQVASQPDRRRTAEPALHRLPVQPAIPGVWYCPSQAAEKAFQSHRSTWARADEGCTVEGH